MLPISNVFLTGQPWKRLATKVASTKFGGWKTLSPPPPPPQKKMRQVQILFIFLKECKNH